jgi:hypothetical protein
MKKDAQAPEDFAPLTCRDIRITATTVALVLIIDLIAILGLDRALFVRALPDAEDTEYGSA